MSMPALFETVTGKDSRKLNEEIKKAIKKMWDDDFFLRGTPQIIIYEGELVAFMTFEYCPPHYDLSSYGSDD